MIEKLISFVPLQLFSVGIIMNIGNDFWRDNRCHETSIDSFKFFGFFPPWHMQKDKVYLSEIRHVIFIRKVWRWRGGKKGLFSIVFIEFWNRCFFCDGDISLPQKICCITRQCGGFIEVGYLSDRLRITKPCLMDRG